MGISDRDYMRRRPDEDAQKLVAYDKLGDEYHNPEYDSLAAKRTATMRRILLLVAVAIVTIILVALIASQLK